MRKMFLIAASSVALAGAMMVTPSEARAEACSAGETKYIVKGSFFGTLFGYDEYRVELGRCTGYAGFQ